MAAAALNRTYNINVTVNLKRGKEEIEYAKSESDKMHNLIANQLETPWAKTRIEKLHEMIFLPNTDQISKEITDKVKATDDENSEE